LLTAYVVVGKVVSVWGVRGELKILPLADQPDFFFDRERMLLRPPGRAVTERRVVDVRPQGRLFRVRFEGITTRDEAESYRDWEVVLPSEEMPELEEGRYYYFQLEGLSVRTVDGEKLGVLDHIIETGSNDVYVVKADNGREILIPALDEVVREVNLGEGVMIIAPLDGMID